MRLHQLEAVAFGPFAERIEVDFDALSESGLFLLTGATGAGKSSVLDAVCFALYGAVPGDRQSAKRLRSDHAAAGVAPEVTLEFGVAGRRFRILRSPAWERPRKRGSGMTREQPRVVLSERVGGAWSPLATRLDDAGHLVSELLGMTLTQFCQVQLLPQGRFQAFLRAESDERHQLLQRLFHTQRFADIELWLRERRRSLRREADRRHDGVADALSRVSEVAGLPLPEPWDLHDLGPVAEELVPWAVSALDRAADEAATAAAASRRATGAESAARRALDAGRVVAERQERHARASAHREAIIAGEPGHRARVAVVQRARRAAAVRPVLEASARATGEAAEAAEAAAEALDHARRLLGRDDCPVGDLPAESRRATGAAAEARARQPHVEELAVLRPRIDDGRRRLAAVATRLDEVTSRADALPPRAARAREDEAAAARAADRLPAARLQAEAAGDRLASAHQALRLTAEREQALVLHRESVDRSQALKEHWLAVQELRLQGMAAEIAGALAVGACCPVCGSAEHPSPAHASPGAPDLAAERAARRALDDAEAERHARAMAVADLTTLLGVARERSGDRTVADLEAEHDDARRVLARLETEAGAAHSATAERERLDAELAELAEVRTSLVADIARFETAVSEQQTRADRLSAELAELLAPTGHPTVAALVGHLEALARACEEAAQAEAQRERAATLASAADARVDEAATEQGFADREEARSSLLPSLLLERLEQEIGRREADLAAASRVLADAHLRAAVAEPAPDLDALVTDHEVRSSERAGAHTHATLTEQRATRLREVTGELEAAVAAWRPLIADLELTTSLAALADGTSSDNRLRMRLSAYVLAYRLSQVVDAANERLARMFDHRYTLEHTGDRGVGESRGGLSLRVRDDWTGDSRDPATLSGGETFVVSLALALGLADVIAHEAGGSELDTLFVDEGFGTLDAETLDQVLDTLDTLRDGGRVVGVVSHVAEMRDRIPTRLHVEKLRAGSTVRQA